MDKKDVLYKNFKKLFELSGLSQNRFAKVTGLLQIQVNKILRKKYSVTDLIINKLKSSLSVDVNNDEVDIKTFKALIEELENKGKVEKATEKYMATRELERVRDNFINLYKNSNLTGEEFGRSINISGSKIYSILHKQSHVSMNVINQIKQVFNIDLYTTDIQEILINDDKTQLRLFKDLYRQTGLSQNQFAKALGIDYTFLSKILSGQRKVGKKNLQKVLDKYNIDLSKTKTIICPKSGKLDNSKIKEDLLTLYKSTPCTKTQFAKMLGVRLSTLNKMLYTDKPISTRTLNQIEKNMGIRLGTSNNMTLVSDSSVVELSNPTYMFLTDDNLTPIVVPTEILAREKARQFKEDGVKFSMFQETIL